MPGREQEIRQVATELDRLLDELRDTVTALGLILTGPEPNEPPVEVPSP